jgi:hypothetical protein
MYRGSISFEEPEPRAPSVRNKDHYREWKRRWVAKNREHVRAYAREYMRAYYHRKKAERSL